MSKLYHLDEHNHEHEIFQKPDGEYYYHNKTLNINVPLMFYNGKRERVTDIESVKGMPRIIVKET